MPRVAAGARGDPGGAGNDYIAFSNDDTGLGNQINYLGITTFSLPGSLTVTTGPGNDEIALYNVRASAAFIYGGTGTNSLETNAATRSGVRTLRYYQFQTVNKV